MGYKIFLPDRDYDEWNRLAPKDLYYSADFALLSKWNFGNDPMAFIYEDKEGKIFYPFIRRPINLLPFYHGELLYDVISLEYGGPMIIGNPNIEEFLNTFHEYCVKENIIAEYIRFNPILKNYQHFEHEKIKDIVYVDLRPEKEQIFQSFRKKCRQSIRNAITRDIKIEEVRTEESISNFFELYIRTMEQHKAKEKWFLRPSYFANVLNFLDKNSSLFLAYHSNKSIVGSIAIYANGVAWDWYRGADRSAQNLRPNNLMVWAIIQEMKRKGCHTLVLGAGYKPDDYIMRFKKMFSDKTFPYCISKRIHGDQKYIMLCQRREWEKPIQNRNFFPLYREGLS